MRVCDMCYQETTEGLVRPARFLIRKMGVGSPQEPDTIARMEACTEHTMSTIERFVGVGNKSKAIIEVVPL